MFGGIGNSHVFFSDSLAEVKVTMKNIRFECFMVTKLNKTLMGCQLCHGVKWNQPLGYCDLIRLGWVLADGSGCLLGLVFQLVCHWSASSFFWQSTKLDYGDHPRFVTTVFEIRLMSQTNFVLHFFPSLVFFWFCSVFLIIFIGMETFLYLVSGFCD